MLRFGFNKFPILSFFDSYLKAKQGAIRRENPSAGPTSDEDAPRKRWRPAKLIDSDSDAPPASEDQSSEDEPPSKIKPPPAKTKQTAKAPKTKRKRANPELYKDAPEDDIPPPKSLESIQERVRKIREERENEKIRKLRERQAKTAATDSEADSRKKNSYKSQQAFKFEVQQLRFKVQQLRSSQETEFPWS